ncbi:hypothetical protein GBP94_25805 [Mycobacterium avium subsp. hominissuis]|uniref:Uncharacterized protein n=1 Tax=Mycobacterium scrofulaceum TaxID=1783 RepID=A0A1X0KKM4_MYCSC|nr:hypothetical protein [Mycobacterium avium subsp. hominissuis]ORB75533.1 hypothetical protein BST44_03240 [Mycobacterium scrofulaceum]MBZ4528148.1 hypothetical protein [Mycobacterium avium subsp. hominissuis]MBZ4547179.1 hypothetical protein [Mycobacterium avium subsp. hominissuis]MBZ4557092.1 hypothetical protein [Mycobacterium avium subsp. hominissuis]
MTSQHRRAITKIVVSAAIALGSVVGASPANADPNAIGGTDPNPFGGLSCSCQKTAPPGGSPSRRAEGIEPGIRAGLSARLPGLPPPTPARSARDVSPYRGVW